MLDADTLFRCSICHGRLEVRDDDACACVGGHEFAIREGVVDLVPPKFDDADRAAIWERHLEAFQARRQHRVDAPSSLTTRLSQRSDQQAVFAEFIDLSGDTVLDVGCGPGRFGRALPAGTRYVGVDPIPLLPDVLDIEFSRSMSEYLPFTDGTFSDVVILHALDHMLDVDASLQEMVRVLRPGGRLHVLQIVLDRRSPLRWLAHEVKDFLEDRQHDHDEHDVPHHMTEFSPASLRDALSQHVQIVRERRWAPSVFAPHRLMITAQAA